MFKRVKNQKGFTLIELMIVIAIIGILAAIAIPNFISYRDKAYCSAAEKDAGSISAALADYFSNPAHITADGLDPVDDLKLTLSGSVVNTATIEQTTPGDPVVITVTDNSGRCPSGDTYVLNMGGDVGQWK